MRSGLTQAALAERFGVSQAAISTWENGTSQPVGDQKRDVVAWVNKSKDADSDDDNDEQERSAFGDWLYNERQRRGWSREELSEKADITAQAIYLIETGRVRSPWKQTRERLASALGKAESPPEDVLDELEKEEQISGGGQLNDFSPWDDKTIPESPCVYVYYDRTDRPIYIGQTSNLRRRNVQHQENDKWFFRRLVERGAFIELKNKAERDRTEQLLIHFLGRNTIFNKQHAKSES